jgi:hypothetical protein
MLGLIIIARHETFLKQVGVKDFPERVFDVGIPFGYPRISILSLAYYGGGLAQGLED